MIYLRQKKTFTLFLAFILLVTFITCEKNPTDNGDEAPPLPPIESMQLDLSFFNSSPNQMMPKATMTKNNFLAAAGRVFVINTVVVLASIVPTALFVTALSQTPELQADGKFHWIYTTQQLGHTYSVDLAGWIDVQNTEAVWEVYVTSTSHVPPLDHFLWYKGRSKIGNAEGWWLFHHDQSPDSLIEVLKIDWKIPDENNNELLISNVYQTQSEYGDSLKYQKENDNNFLIFHDASTTEISSIYWDSSAGNGYIEWFDYKEGVKSCWDDDQNDIDCPPPF